MVHKVFQEMQERMERLDHKVFREFKVYRVPQDIRVGQDGLDLWVQRPIQVQLETQVQLDPLEQE
jgi:hypothetical protein